MNSLRSILLPVSTSLLLIAYARGQTELIRILGDAGGDHLGLSVARMGDLDNDGFPDLTVAAPTGGAVGEGIVKVVSGQTGNVIHSWAGLAAGDRFGFAVAYAGDINGDGVDDVVVGSPLADVSAPDAGLIRVHSGSSGAILRQWTGGQTGFQFGFSVGGGSDINGDGFDDVIGGEPKASFTGVDAGRARVHIFQLNAPWVAWNGSTAGERAGHSVAFVGDLNSDGKNDFVVGAPGALGIAGTGSANSAGAVYVHSGGNGSLFHTLIAPGMVGAPGVVGWSVATAGDVDGDGVNDLITGGLMTTFSPCGPGPNGPCGTSEHSVWVVSYGGAVPFLIRWHKTTVPTDDFGWAVAPAGDVDGDGRADYVLGSPSASDGTINPGAVHVMSGAAWTPFNTWNPIKTYFGKTPTARCGASVSQFGDMDGDGRSEILVGIPNDDDGGADAGAAVVVRPLAAAVQKEIALGDKLVGTFVAGSVWHDFSFDAVSGTQIHLDVSSKNGLGAKVVVLDPNMIPIKSWSLAPWHHLDVGATASLSGTHRLRIQPDVGSTGDYAVDTTRKLPASAKSQKKVLKGSGAANGPLVLPFLAMKDAKLSLTVVAKKKSPFTPIVTLIDATGVEVAPMSAGVVGGVDWVDLELQKSGLYKVVVKGLVTGKEKTKIDLHLDQPKGNAKHVTVDL